MSPINSNRFLLTELYTEVLTKAVTYYCLDHINLKKVKQNNGKENVIIRLNRRMERKMCFNTYFRGISSPRTSRV